MILGVGTDIIEIDRIKRAYKKRPGKMLEKFFGPKEKEYILSKKNPYPHMAVRFCAKEAFVKALGTGIGKISLNEFQIINNASGSPGVLVSGKAKRMLEELGGHNVNVNVSLSHTGALATAYVIISKSN